VLLHAYENISQLYLTQVISKTKNKENTLDTNLF